MRVIKGRPMQGGFFFEQDDHANAVLEARSADRAARYRGEAAIHPMQVIGGSITLVMEPSTYPSLFAALARSLSLGRLYRAVVSSRLCPRKVAAVTRSTSGFRTSCVATVWRKVFGVTPSTSARAAFLLFPLRVARRSRARSCSMPWVSPTVA